MAVLTVEIPVALTAGEECDACADRIALALAEHRGVEGVRAVGPSTLAVSFDPEQCNLECVNDAAVTIGVDLGRRFGHDVRSVEGMDCYDCAQTIERAAARIEGVVHCGVNFAGGRMRLEYDAATPGVPEAVEQAVIRLGYRLGPTLGGAPVREDVGPWWRRRGDESITGLAALATMVAAVLGGDAGIALYLVAVVIGGWEIARSGLRATIATRSPGINLLMTIAVIGAIAIGAWLEAALVVVLFRIGENLERYAVDRARRSLEALVELSPTKARRRSTAGDTTTEEEVAAESLLVGDEIVVRPGEDIPADGTVIDGLSTVDQARITGESVPVDKEPGASVFAGTINGEGVLVVRVDAAAGATTLDKVTRLVAEAQAQRTPSERWVDAFARIYTPVVLAVAITVAVLPPLVGLGSFDDWLYRGLAFLILACPCALVIATPVAIVAALARASRAGILVKGGAHLESVATLRAVAFDKTGTLTIGRPEVVDIVPADSVDPDELLTIAASIDAGSEHPLARAIVDAATERGLTRRDVDDFQSVRGLGVVATLDGTPTSVGNRRFYADHPALAAFSPEIEQLESRGRSVVIVANPTTILGALGLADQPRPQANEAITGLRALGIAHTVLLTGDHAAAAQAIAHNLGITDVRADLMPADKVDALDALLEQFGPTAMVGDGVNDAPALARASVGIAMGGAGSPAAIETADITLMADDPRKLVELILLARRTRGIVLANIVLSLATKAIAAGFALFGLLPLWLAVLADVGATLVVVANGLRLMRATPARTTNNGARVAHELAAS